MTLIEAIKQNNKEEVFRLLNLKIDPSGKKFIDEVDEKYGESALHWAAYYGYVHFIDPLVKAGADVNKQDKDGCTPVYDAASKGHATAITALKTAGANVDTPDKDGWTPVYIAAQGGHAAAITALHAAGANVDTPNKYGETPVFIAAQKGHAAAITALKTAGANVNTPEKSVGGCTPVFIAAVLGHAEAITALKAAGANVDTPDRTGTPVYIAAFSGHAAAITALHTAGANVDTSNKYGKTPVHIAAEMGHAAAITALLEAGADASIKTKWGTPLEQAKQGKEPAHAEVVKLLEAHLKQYPNGIKPVQAAGKAAAKIPTSASVSSVDKEVKTTREPEVKTARDLLTEPKTPARSKSPAALKSTSNPVTSTNPLLQSLQLQLTELQKQSTASSFSDMQTSAKISLATTLDHDLQAVEKEKQALNQTPQTLQIQSERLQGTLQREIDAEAPERTRLAEQKADFEKQIADLQQSLVQKTGAEQQKMQASLKALQEQLLVVQTQHDILWNEYDLKNQKRKALKRFQSNPNLLLFYRTVHIKLEEIFISFKSVAGGFVNPVEGDAAFAKSIFESIGDAASIAPIVGAAVDKFLKWTVCKGLEKLDSARQKNTAVNASALVTISELKKYAGSIARQLTERYEDQLLRLATPEEEQAEASKLKQGCTKAKEATLKEQHAPSAKRLAAFGVLWIMEQLYDAEHIDDSKPLDEVLLSRMSQKKPANKLTECWQAVTTKLGIECVLSKRGESWHPAAVYTLPGLKTANNEYYSNDTLKPNTYGWRLGTVEEAQALGLRHVSAPNAQSVSISPAGTKNVQQLRQETKENGEKIDIVVKTLDIGVSAQVKALQAEIANLKKMIEPSRVSPHAQRRSSEILNLTDKKDEKEKARYVLEELRTFFREGRDIGAKTENYVIYNQYLKKDHDAELTYNATKNKHVLYVGEKPVDAETADREISKMIKSLADVSSTLPPPRHQPMRAVSPSPVNSPKAAPRAAPPIARMLNQFQAPRAAAAPPLPTPASQTHPNRLGAAKQKLDTA